jgi:hypothetical protein
MIPALIAAAFAATLHAAPPSGAIALAPLLGEDEVQEISPVEPAEATFASFDSSLAPEVSSDLQRLQRLSSALAVGEEVPRNEKDWARERLLRATSGENLKAARERLLARIRRDGVYDDFGGEQLLPPGAPDRKVEPWVESRLRGARQAARQLLQLIDAER